MGKWRVPIKGYCGNTFVLPRSSLSPLYTISGTYAASAREQYGKMGCWGWRAKKGGNGAIDPTSVLHEARHSIPPPPSLCNSGEMSMAHPEKNTRVALLSNSRF